MKNLLKFRSIQNLLGELKLLTRSKNTENTYLKGIKKFVEYFGIKDLDKFIEEVKRNKEADEYCKKFMIYLASQNLAPKTIGAWSSAIKKLFETNGIQLNRKMKVRMYTIHEDILPSKEIIKKIVESANLRTKAILLFLISSGVRAGELINLKLKDLDFNRNPVKVRIRGIGAKERKSRITFISDEAAQFLEKYLEKRRKKGETLNDESFVFVTKNGKKMSYQNLHFLLSNVFKKFSKKEGKRYQLHPHVLRKFFKTQLIAAGVPSPIVDRLTGHRRYLSEEYELYTEEQLREWYKKGMKNLTLGIE